jgi:hypothetical protein
MSWKGNYCLERTDSVRSECLAELIRFIRKAIPNTPSQCCAGQESVASDAAAACCIELLGLATLVQKGNSNIKAHYYSH